ncbi:MAG: ABC transporter permease subunit [Pseudomonadota bacterium]
MGLYAPWMALAFAAAVIGAAMAARIGRNGVGSGSLPDAISNAGPAAALTAERRTLTADRAMLAGGLVALVPAALLIVPLAGDVIGTGAQHLYVVLTPVVGGLISAWLFLRRSEHDAAWGTMVQAAGRITLRAVPGVFVGFLVLGLGSNFGAINNVPAGAPMPTGTFTLFGQVGDYLWHITLPVAALTLSAFAGLTLLTKNSFLDEVRKQYVVTAKAKGLKEGAVLYGHVFRNAMLIVISGFPQLFIAVFFGGSLLIETIFSLDGLGRLGFEAAIGRDYPVMFGTLYAFALLGLVMNLITDLTYVLVDPRIDFERREA